MYHSCRDKARNRQERIVVVRRGDLPQVAYRSIMTNSPGRDLHSRQEGQLRCHIDRPPALPPSKPSSPKCCMRPQSNFWELGARAQDVLPAEVASTLLDLTGQAHDSGQMGKHQHRLSFADRPRAFKTQIVPHRPDKILSIVRNITERVQAEEAYRTLVAHALRRSRRARNFASYARMMPSVGWRPLPRASTIAAGWPPRSLTWT